jgi:hypothetical protein
MFERFLASLMLVLLMTASGWCQTDPEGRALAWQLYEAYEAGSGSGNYVQFEALFMRDAQLTKRACVSALEYATEIYQQDLNAASAALIFANELAGLIGRQFGDQAPSSLIQRMMSQDPTAMGEFSHYAISLYPGYASSASANQSPGQGPVSHPGAPAYAPSQNGQGFPAYAPSQAPPRYPASGPFRPADATGGPPKE